MSDRTVMGGALYLKGRALPLVVAAVFACAGFLVLGSARGVDATWWMHMWAVSEIDSADKFLVTNLRVPIPIVLSSVEIAAYNMLGSTYLITHILYRFAVVFSYVLAIWVFSDSRHRLLLCTFISFVFLWCTALIHPGSPQMYDVLFPFFNLLFVGSLKYVGAHDDSSTFEWRTALLCLLAGFSLSMFELLRPFVFFLLPFFVFCVFLRLRRMPMKYFACFLLPLVLFSGSWHAFITVPHAPAAHTLG